MFSQEIYTIFIIYVFDWRGSVTCEQGEKLPTTPPKLRWVVGASHPRVTTWQLWGQNDAKLRLFGFWVCCFFPHTHTHTRKKHRACIYPASRNGRNIPSNAQHEDLSKWHPEVMFNLFFDLCWNVTGLFSSWWYVHRPGRFQNVCEWSGFSRSLDVMAHSS